MPPVGPEDGAAVDQFHERVVDIIAEQGFMGLRSSIAAGTLGEVPESVEASSAENLIGSTFDWAWGKINQRLGQLAEADGQLPSKQIYDLTQTIFTLDRDPDFADTLRFAIFFDMHKDGFGFSENKFEDGYISPERNDFTRRFEALCREAQMVEGAFKPDELAMMLANYTIVSLATRIMWQHEELTDDYLQIGVLGLMRKHGIAC